MNFKNDSKCKSLIVQCIANEHVYVCNRILLEYTISGCRMFNLSRNDVIFNEDGIFKDMIKIDKTKKK